MITAEEFLAEVQALSDLLPFSRRLKPENLVAIWDLMPMAARQHLSQEVLRFAVGQRLLDPAPPESALHVSLMRYIFPLRDGVPDFSAGLRQDLHLRLADPSRFHDPTRRAESVRPQLLANGEQSWHPSQMTLGERRAALERAKSDLQRMSEGGAFSAPLRPSEAKLGERLFAAVLAGFTHLDARTLAASWAVRNYDTAMGHIDSALAIANPNLPTAPLAVAGILGWQPQYDPGEESTFEEELGL